jgi:hypothetical protein
MRHPAVPRHRHRHPDREQHPPGGAGRRAVTWSSHTRPVTSTRAGRGPAALQRAGGHPADAAQPRRGRPLLRRPGTASARAGVRAHLAARSRRRGPHGHGLGPRRRSPQAVKQRAPRRPRANPARLPKIVVTLAGICCHETANDHGRRGQRFRMALPLATRAPTPWVLAAAGLRRKDERAVCLGLVQGGWR